MCDAFRTVAPAVAAASPAAGRAAVCAICRALLPADLIPRLIAEADEASTDLQVTLLYAFEYAAGTHKPAETPDSRLPSIVLRSLGQQAAETFSNVQRLACRTLVSCSAQRPTGVPAQASVALRQLTALCGYSFTRSGVLSIPVACDVATHIFSSPHTNGAFMAEFADLLLPHCLALLSTEPCSAGALVVSDMMPLVLSATAIASRMAARNRVWAVLLKLLAADTEAVRATGLAVGVRFTSSDLFASPGDLCNSNAELCRLLHRCLQANNAICRRRALFILSAVVGCRLVAGCSSASPKPKVRRRKNQSTELQSGWAAFMWAYVAVEIGTEALSPKWAKVLEALAHAVTLPVHGGTVPAVPWVQLLLKLGIRHSNPNVRRCALDAALASTTFNGSHTMLVDGDDFVLSCCDMMSDSSVAAVMFSDIRASDCSSTSRVTVLAFLNRQLSASESFLRRWVEWFACRVNGPPGSQPCPTALLHVCLHWLATIPDLESQVPAQCGLTDQNLLGLAQIVVRIGTSYFPASTAQSVDALDGIRPFALRSVISAAIRLTESAPDMFQRLAPIFALAGPQEFQAHCSGTDWLSQLSAGCVVNDLEAAVSSFLRPAEGLLESFSAGLGTEQLASAAATLMCIVAGGCATEQRAVSIFRLGLCILEHAHAHVYQPLAKFDRAVLLVNATMAAMAEGGAHLESSAGTALRGCEIVRKGMREWLLGEGVAEAVSTALGTLLMKWAASQSEDPDNNRQAGEPSGATTTITASAAGSYLSFIAQLQRCSASRKLVEPVLGKILLQLLRQCDISSMQTSMAGLSRLELALDRLRGPYLGGLVLSGDHVCDTIMTVLLVGSSALTSAQDCLRWRCIHLAASSRCAFSSPCSSIVSRDLVLELLSHATVALKVAADWMTTRILIAAFGDALMLSVGVRQKSSEVHDTDMDEALTKCQRMSLNACECGCAKAPVANHVPSDRQRFAVVQVLMHPAVFAQSSDCGSDDELLRFAFNKFYGMAVADCTWAPVLALHCTRMWLRYPSVAALHANEIARLCCYASVRRGGTRHQHMDKGLSVQQTETELLVRATMLSFLSTVSKDSNREQLANVLILQLLELVVEYYRKQPQYDDSTPIHKMRVSLGQSVCVLVSNVQLRATVAEQLHSAIAEKVMHEYLPSERQYLDLLMIQLFRKSPELAGQWLPSVVTNCTLRPQIMQGMLLVTGTWLLHLELQAHMQYFKPLLRALLTWIHSGHRGLRSLVQVLVLCLLQDCHSRASSARKCQDSAALAYYTALDEDEQLSCIGDYLQTAAEGGEFRQRLLNELNAFNPDQLCQPASLLGRSNFVDHNGTHGGRAFVPNGIGPESERFTIAAAKLATACWLPDSVLRTLCASMNESTNPLIMPWADMLLLGHGRLPKYSTVRQPSQNRTSKLGGTDRCLVVVASLLDKRPNIAGLCRTTELLGGCELVVHDKRLLNHEQSRAISQSAESSLKITEIPVPWLLEYLEDKRRHGFHVIAIEQTSSSTSIEAFEWPEKAVLLLGKEKEGVPAAFLRSVDVCVEIPQLGIIRSLNVHVSAAISLAQAVLSSQSSDTGQYCQLHEYENSVNGF